VTILGDDFRRRAEDNNQTAAELFSSAQFATDAKIRASMIVAKVTANVLSVGGEIVDFLAGAATVDEATQRRHTIAERADAIRKAFVAAAATGDYTRYDQLVAEFAAGLGNGSSTGSAGDQGGDEESSPPGGA
jgi:hypothetical protein